MHDACISRCQALSPFASRPPARLSGAGVTVLYNLVRIEIVIADHTGLFVLLASRARRSAIRGFCSPLTVSVAWVCELLPDLINFD